MILYLKTGIQKLKRSLFFTLHCGFKLVQWFECRFLVKKDVTLDPERKGFGELIPSVRTGWKGDWKGEHEHMTV